MVFLVYLLRSLLAKCRCCFKKLLRAKGRWNIKRSDCIVYSTHGYYLFIYWNYWQEWTIYWARLNLISLTLFVQKIFYFVNAFLRIGSSNYIHNGKNSGIERMSSIEAARLNNIWCASQADNRISGQIVTKSLVRNWEKVVIFVLRKHNSRGCIFFLFDFESNLSWSTT